MQKPISDKIQIGQTLNPAKDYGGENYKRQRNTRKHNKQGR